MEFHREMSDATTELLFPFARQAPVNYMFVSDDN
jgi:hypothetical protein